MISYNILWQSKDVLPWPKKMETPDERLNSMDARKVDMHVLSISLMHWHGLDNTNAVAYAKDVMMTYQTMQALMGTDLNHSVFCHYKIPKHR